MLIVYFVLTVFSCFFRPDFVNVTICVVAAYMLVDTESIQKKTFRNLVFAIVWSFVYDFIWLVNTRADY